MDVSLKHFRLAQKRRVVLELSLREAEQILNGHKNLTNCLKIELDRALKADKAIKAVE